MDQINSNPKLAPRWTSERVYTDGHGYFEELMQHIAAARSSIDLEYYIFEPGALGQRMVIALCQAAARGVRVRMHIDAIGSPEFKSEFGQELKMAGVKVRVFNQLTSQLWRALTGKVSLARGLSILNRRNHRKICIIDRQQLWVGSFNVSDKHLEEIYGSDAWRDAGACVEGPDVQYVWEAFDCLYRFRPFMWWRWKPQLVLLNQGSSQRARLRRVQKKRLLQAKERIWIQNPYFVPIRSIYRILLRRAREGLDVRIIVPRKNDIFFMRLVSYSYFKEMIESGIKIYEFLPAFSHQKLLHVDEAAYMGSINFNHRSFLHDLEIEVQLTSAESKQSLHALFLEEMEQSRLLTLEALRKDSLWHKLLSRLFLLIRYWS